MTPPQIGFGVQVVMAAKELGGSLQVVTKGLKSTYVNLAIEN